MVTATIIPKKTPVPMAWRLAEPGPLAITIGSMPKLITLEETSRVSYVYPLLNSLYLSVAYFALYLMGIGNCCDVWKLSIYYIYIVGCEFAK